MELKEAIIHTRQVAEGCGVDSRDCAYQHDKLGDWLEELQTYKSIGTIEEFRAIKKMEMEQRLVELPVPEGTVFYRKMKDGDIQRCQFTIHWLDDYRRGMKLHNTKQEAEAALGGGESE